MNKTTKVVLCLAFVLELTNKIATKPLFLKIPSLRSRVANEKSMSQEIDMASDVNGFLENPATTNRNRTARSMHPCVSGIVREYDHCRKRWVMKVQCDRAHPGCNHVIPIHSIPKCQTVYGYRNSKFITKCPSLPIDCKCAS